MRGPQNYKCFINYYFSYLSAPGKGHQMVILLFLNHYVIITTYYDKVHFLLIIHKIQNLISCDYAIIG